MAAIYCQQGSRVLVLGDGVGQLSTGAWMCGMRVVGVEWNDALAEKMQQRLDETEFTTKYGEAAAQYVVNLCNFVVLS
jgi:16S rRNA A1518/A1519 N6-dimethyltransferase RsmA/KsgA/DIM1 with predicted DNA glycosylase/AP lyase activity